LVVVVVAATGEISWPMFKLRRLSAYISPMVFPPVATGAGTGTAAGANDVAGTGAVAGAGAVAAVTLSAVV
jgi:hypothetical protein